SNYVHAGAAEDERLSILERTKTGKVKRAREGCPVASKRPFGRVWDRKADKVKAEGEEYLRGWTIDPAKLAAIREIARRYLAGEGMEKLAKEFGMAVSTLYVTLTARWGDTWAQRVRCKELGIDEVIQPPVPRLLPEETIAAIKRQTEANRTYKHGQTRTPYLLGRVVLCAECGYAMSG